MQLFIMLELVDWMLVQILQVKWAKAGHLLLKSKLITSLVTTMSFLLLTEALSVLPP